MAYRDHTPDKALKIVLGALIVIGIISGLLWYYVNVYSAKPPAAQASPATAAVTDATAAASPTPAPSPTTKASDKPAKTTAKPKGHKTRKH